ncbi:anti-sigma-factor antagonist [cyanobacterium endosymbiont of Epithemia turgida isolate EtSB Lake Yunoko]|nr:anti-sigma-factor antagonist [cyanobacterium endosymbiont of Epithemia turgida isolate EtSB Lake Yunoko]
MMITLKNVDQFKSLKKFTFYVSQRYNILSELNPIIDSEEEAIPEQLILTVSLRGTRDVQSTYQIFRLTGLLDAFSEPTFRKVIGNCIDEGPANIILVLSQIDFIDSSGLGALVQLVKKAQTNKGSLQIVTNPRVTQTVKLVRLEKFLSLQTSVEDAINNLPKIVNS